MTVKLGVVMDPIENITYKKDSSLAMLLAAQQRGWELWYMELPDLYLHGDQARANMKPLRVMADPECWFERSEGADLPLADLDVILMRKDPPVDREFLIATHILEAAQRDGTLVVNPPQALRDCNEKLYATWFPQCTPPLIVTRDPARLRAFHAEHSDVVMKPIDGMGGKSVFRVRPGDANLGVIIETLTQDGQHQIMAQKYLPQISEGDKRILLIDGEPLPFALARVPAAGENRGNLAAGGRGEGRELTERDRWICAQLGPALRERNLIFVGIDVIGEYLTEINVTSPTCIRELDKAFDVDIGGQLMEAIARRLPASK
ncbi:glutathione synthase [Hydrocarboniclastica marina]|uniref:Glutathione synthetase n=1 Tax=Hydrocarboniclastica marina TaxID=2259620 RepID=A0A4P7XDS9_9ALTE|nr:glutathione synthase [Hydrocarboniclastica marina]MAL98813.1 glutathione synthase [Alteromonadaceae bacterium]QCF24693.1 glutathione synthase [Hydrocarboniclastica marina]